MTINYLVIEGNIGSGKTTLSKMIAERFQARMLLEGFENNPFLPRFYKEPEKYAFPLEMSFLADRYNQLSKNIAHLELFSPFLVSDYYFIKSLIFAQNTLSNDEYQLYSRFFNIIYDKIPNPDLYVYLHADTGKLARQIKKRGRDYEQTIDSAYLEKIENGYFSFFKQEQDFPVLVIDTNKLDFVRNENDFDLLMKLIFEKPYGCGLNRVLIDQKS